MNEILEIIEELRKRYKYSVNKMCKDIGIPQSTYSTWLQDDREPKSKYVRSIAEYFNKPISYFYDAEIKKSVDDSELSDAKREFIDFAKSLPDEEIRSMFRIMKFFHEEWQLNR